MERVVSDSTEYLAGDKHRFETEGEPIWLGAQGGPGACACAS
jgi:hypothetical protein